MSGGGQLELALQGFQGIENFCKKCNNSDMKHHCKNAKGFTLAEVLITLGIIGVVAAMTLPSLINQYRVKQLHTAFMRSSSIIQNAMNQTASEFGYGNFKELNNICGTLPESQTSSCLNSNKQLFEDINSDLLSRFNKLKEMKQFTLNQQRIKVYNFSGMSNILYGELYGVGGYGILDKEGLYYLPDGTVISSLFFFYHGKYDGLTMTFDTNGPSRGPNRYGYDIFIYNTGTWYKLCTKKQDGGDYNGRGCYDYAIKDVNPDDNTKGYWDSLY